MGSSPELRVLETVERVVAQSRRVSFHPGRIPEAVARWSPLLSPVGAWDHPCHYQDHSAETARWIFVLDILNHCFWPDPGLTVWTVHQESRPWSGYWALAASLKRAVKEKIPITRADFLADISSERLTHIFRGDGEIPLFEERLANLREAGSSLVRDWGGDVVNLIQSACGSGARLIEQVVASFPSFRDEARYGGRTILFWKRAQLLVSDLYHAFGGEGLGGFGDVHELTAFADYKLPQVLRALGIISYEPRLEETIDGLQTLVAGSPEEVEIRAMTIWAVEEIKEAFARAGRPVTSAAVDQWLWQLGQIEPFRQKPYHRCRTIYY